jgi:CubicO group peptidase (beta-lactamase class C family)
MATTESPQAAGMSSERLTRIRPVLQSYVDRHGYPGFAVMAWRRGHVVLDEQIGWRDREEKIPLGDDTIFRIYSMTKPVIATALMILFEEGAFQLADPVASYIPAFAQTKVATADGGVADQPQLRPMQVRDLLTHTSGLTYDFAEDFPVAKQYRAARLMNDPKRPLSEVIAELAAIPLAFNPGSMYHYSLGLDVAAYLIEVLSGQPVGDFLRERLFGPLGMGDTGFGVPHSERHRLATMYGLPDLFGPDATISQLTEAYLADGSGRRDVEATYPSDTPDVFQRGGIGLFSTARDYLRFAQMLLSGRAEDGTRLLGRKTLELMHANHLQPELLPYRSGGIPNPGWGFGLGSRVNMDPGLTALPGSVGEFGWSGAAKTYYWVDPHESLVGVLMTQFMVGFDHPEADFRTLVYQAIDD